MSAPRITQKEIARRLGITQAAVSLALANHPSISEAMRRKVRRLADRLGYVPDPYLSGLSAYRKKVRPVHYQATLAWVTNHPGENAWRTSRVFQGYHEGAIQRAGELGYVLEHHWLRAPDITNRRLEKILNARGIVGLLMAPQPEPNQQIDFDFTAFPAVTFGYTLARPQLNLVTLHQFRSMETAFRRLLAMGYRRPGLALADDSDQRADRNWSAAFWSEQRALPAKNRVPLLLARPLAKAGFIAWFRRHRPDVVLTIWPEVRDWLLEAGESIPGTTGFALLSVPDESGNFSGIWENPQLIGSKAVELLVDMIHRGESGVPPTPICVLVEGIWIPGKTLARQE